MKFNLKNERTKMYIVLILIVLIGKFYIKPKIENFQDSSTDKSLPKIYVINLKKDVTRLNNIKKQFKSKNLEFERIDGIDGRIISRDELKKYTTWFCGNFCSKEIIGCFLSHKKAWNKIANGKERGAIILEDDAILLNDFKRKIIKVIDNYHKSPDIDILLLHCIFACDYQKNYGLNIFAYLCSLFLGTNQKIISKDFYIPELPGSATGYYISKEVAQKLCNKIKYARWHVDISVYNSKEFKGKVAMITDPLIDGNTSISSNSTLKNIDSSFLDKIIIDSKKNTSAGWLLTHPIITVFEKSINGLHLLGLFIISLLLFFIYPPFAKLILIILIILSFIIINIL